jgi:UDP-perosamine 4-acetyltransferase
MKTPVIVLGGGGHSKVVIDAIRSISKFKILGITDPAIKKGTKVSNYLVIGNDTVLFSSKKRMNALLVLGFGNQRSDLKRKNVYEKLKTVGYSFATIIHREACIAKSSSIGEGAQVMAKSVIQPDSAIGENTIINTSAIIEHDCFIGKHCHIAPGAILGGNVRVGDSSFVGLGSRVLPGVKIGKNVTIGAGAVVLHDIEDGKTVAGVPCKELGKRK